MVVTIQYAKGIRIPQMWLTGESLQEENKMPEEKRRAMTGFFAPAKPAFMPSIAKTWAQRFKRVFTKSRHFRRH